MKNETRYAQLLLGGDLDAEIPAALVTDGYKLSMAEAGFPLRRETFYLALRKPGPHKIPFDFKVVVEALVEAARKDLEEGFPPEARRALNSWGYALTPAMKMALGMALELWTAPKGAWVRGGEPIVTPTGASFLVSWLEPLVIMFNFPIQVATEIANGRRKFKATCSHEAQIIRLVMDEMGVTDGDVTVHKDEYRLKVRETIKATVDAVGDPSRIFEVGLRSATCMQQHLIVLEECATVGVNMTSNVAGAYALREHGIFKWMKAVGTTGHEHQQRWLNDGDGFRAIRDKRAAKASYLFDTYDAMTRGIPAAIEVMQEDLTRDCAVRFDSGDQDAQLRLFLDAEKKYGVQPTYIFEDGYTAERARSNEALCDSLGVSKDRRLYGFGGFFVNVPEINDLVRDRVQAVYKLSQTGNIPVRKHAGTKSSDSGIPVILRTPDGRATMIAQKGEGVMGMVPIEKSDLSVIPDMPMRSLQTSTLNEECRKRAGLWI